MSQKTRCRHRVLLLFPSCSCADLLYRGSYAMIGVKNGVALDEKARNFLNVSLVKGKQPPKKALKNWIGEV